MNKYYKEDNGAKIWFKEPLIYDKKQIFGASEELILAAGWTKYIETEPTQEELDKIEASRRISELKNLLREGDYQVIKCAEAKLLGEDMPYDITELFSKRNTYRDEINSLQNQYNL